MDVSTEQQTLFFSPFQGGTRIGQIVYLYTDAKSPLRGRGRGLFGDLRQIIFRISIPHTCTVNSRLTFVSLNAGALRITDLHFRFIDCACIFPEGGLNHSPLKILQYFFSDTLLITNSDFYSWPGATSLCSAIVLEKAASEASVRVSLVSSAINQPSWVCWVYPLRYSP